MTWGLLFTGVFLFVIAFCVSAYALNKAKQKNKKGFGNNFSIHNVDVQDDFDAEKLRQEKIFEQQREEEEMWLMEDELLWEEEIFENDWA